MASEDISYSDSTNHPGYTEQSGYGDPEMERRIQEIRMASMNDLPQYSYQDYAGYSPQQEQLDQAPAPQVGRPGTNTSGR